MDTIGNRNPNNNCKLDHETDVLLNPNQKRTNYHNGLSSTPSYKKILNGRNDKRKDAIPFHLRTVRLSLYIFTKVLNVAYIPVFIYRMFESSRICPPVIDPILRIPAVELAKAIRKKTISCERVIEAYISRIKEVNPLLNAVIEDRFEDALEDARQVDKRLSETDADEAQLEINQPLLGIPITIKGSLAVKGMKHTSGSVIRKRHDAEFDADVVVLAKKAGAIPLLVSNVPEFCMSWETTNKLIGTTNNPHDLTRTCGGSSGGEASLLAAGASLIGIGSDIAGSLRLPAHYCGVWGHKPTPGAVSFDGHFPSCQQRDKWESVFTVGPMARYASDLRILLKVIAVPEKLAKLNLDKKIDLRDIKVFYSEHEDYYWQEPNLHCSAAVKKVVNYLRKISNRAPEKVDFYLSHNAPDIASLSVLTIEDIEDGFDGNSNGVFTELMRYTTMRSKHTFMLIACGLLRKIGMNSSEKQKHKINNFVSKIRTEFEEILGDDGVFVVPSFPSEAPKHGDVLRTAMYSGYLTIFNALGFAVTNCPVGVTEEGLPVGVQIATKRFGDNLTLTIAEEIERAFGGWIEPRNRN